MKWEVDEVGIDKVQFIKCDAVYIGEYTLIYISVLDLGGGSVPQWLHSLDHSPVEVFLYRSELCISTKTAHHSLITSGKSTLRGQLIVVLLKSLQILLVPSQCWTPWYSCCNEWLFIPLQTDSQESFKLAKVVPRMFSLMCLSRGSLMH